METNNRTETKSHTVSNHGTEQKQEQTVASSENDETSDGFNSSPAYANNFDGHLPLHWLQPKEEGNTKKEEGRSKKEGGRKKKEREQEKKEEETW